MTDTEPQTAGGKVLWHFTMSLDGFVAGPEHDMSWLTGFSVRPGLIDEYVTTTGAVLGGRAGWDAVGDNRPYGGAWTGPVFVLTHHPEDATPADGVTFLDCDPAEAVRIGLAAAGGKNLEVFSPTIGRRLLELGLIDEIDLHIAPVLLGAGIRLYDNPGGEPIRLDRVGDDPTAAVNVRYRPVRREDAGRPAVLFLCVHNAGRSQMALGFFRHLAGDGAIAWSGGSEPGAEVNPAAVAAMREVGIDISGEFPKPWTDEVVRAADVVVTMGCGDACPVFPGKRYEDWTLADPAGRDVAGVRPIRDEIERRVRTLLSELDVPVRS